MEAKYTDNLPQFGYTAQQVQENEAQAAANQGISLWQLMQEAALSVFSLFEEKLSHVNKVAVLAGKGNNAGDAYLVAMHLHQTGRVVRVQSLYDPSLLQGDAHKAYIMARSAGVDISAHPLVYGEYDAVLDGVFGTGFKGELPKNIQDVFNQVTQSAVLKVSIDVPSGVNATTAQVSTGAFIADHTVTFIGLKQGMLTGSAQYHSGELLFAGLGVDKALAELISPTVAFTNQHNQLLLRPKRAVNSYKNQCGHVLLIGGNRGMAGAIRLAAEACLRMGAGLVSVATHPDNVQSVLHGRYELMVHGVADANELQVLMSKADVVVIGPGLGQDTWAKSLYDTTITYPGDMVIDADGLNFLAQTPIRLNNAVLTPHQGEAKRLLAGEYDLTERFICAQALNQTYASTIVLKGPGSLIVDNHSININRSGCAGMASAGMGDVLSGMIGALMAQGLSKFAAAQLAVYIHGLAAQIAAKEGEKGLLASDLFIYIRRLLG